MILYLLTGPMTAMVCNYFDSQVSLNWQCDNVLHKGIIYLTIIDTVNANGMVMFCCGHCTRYCIYNVCHSDCFFPFASLQSLEKHVSIVVMH